MGDFTMSGYLLHEMVRGSTDGDHGDNSQAEMLRPRSMGAPTNELDFEDTGGADEQ
jgi:hypothetical protein